MSPRPVRRQTGGKIRIGLTTHSKEKNLSPVSLLSSMGHSKKFIKLGAVKP